MALLQRVFAALVDPLDNSLWLARPDGWTHFQPELQLWDQGSVPDGVQTIAFDGNDPTQGFSFGRDADGSCCRAAGWWRRPVGCPPAP